MCEFDKATAEHQWLARMVGEWESESSCVMAPGEPNAISKTRDIVRTIGDLWLVTESEGTNEDKKFRSVTTVGFDVKQGKFVGSFCCSEMSRLWIYEGSLEGNTLTLLAMGPSWTDPNKMVEYADVIELVSDDHKVLKSYSRENPEAPVCFMTMTSRRVKKWHF